MKTSWEKTEGKRTEYIDVHYHEVVVGHHYGTGMSDIAGACSHKEFIEGRFHSLIVERFGEDVLDEVIFAVNNSYKNSEHNKHRDEDQRILSFFNSIPTDPSLEGLISQPDTENGHDNIGNAGGKKTILKNEKATFTFTSTRGYIEPAGKEKISIKFNGYGESSVMLNDHFFLLSDDFVVISPEGEILFTTYEPDRDIAFFGSTIRMGWVYKNKDIIFFSYRWFNNNYPRGIIKYQLEEGLTGRWELEY